MVVAVVKSPVTVGCTRRERARVTDNFCQLLLRQVYWLGTRAEILTSTGTRCELREGFFFFCFARAQEVRFAFPQ